MKKTALLAFMLLPPLCIRAATPSDFTVELAFTGIFGEATPFPRAGTTWLALVPAAGAFHLVSTRVELEPVANQCTDSYKRVIATGVTEPLFLIRGSPALRPGPADSVFHGRPRFLFPAETLSLQLKGGEWFGFGAYGTASKTGVTDYQIVIFRGRHEQVIVNIPIISMDGPPELIWAGDLDRDNAPDAIFDVSTSYASDTFVLFLSSQADSGQMVREVARFHVPGC